MGANHQHNDKIGEIVNNKKTERMKCLKYSLKMWQKDRGGYDHEIWCVNCQNSRVIPNVQK
jgi:hypothetical protein